VREQRCACGQPVTDRYLCEGCEIRLHNNLTELVELNSELHTALTRMVRMTERAERGRSFEKPLMFNQKAAETIRLIRSTLVDWVRVLHKDTGTALPQRATVTSLVGWLDAQLPGVVAHREDSRILEDEIKHLRDEAQRTVDLPANRTTYQVGPCPEDLETGPCAGLVWAVIPRDETHRPRMECRSCKTAWFTEAWHSTARRILTRAGRPVPASEVSYQRLRAVIG
jgi:hypothetical protein